MLNAVFLMGGLGLIVGVCLAVAAKVFYVYVDPKIEAVEDALPGANCGGCGLPGCGANAEAIVAGKASPSSCVAGDAELAFTIAGIMGVSVEAKEPDIARPGCYYGVGDADLKFIYNGLNDCRAAVLLSGGMKVCTIGCLGLGTCEKVCPFDAISMGPDGLPKIDELRCTGCGTCERVCPKHIITLSSATRRILKEYTSEECTTPCQRACPAGIDIREYILQIEQGNYHRAVQVIKERNPFPAVIGRICPRPCELDCRRKHIDEPVAINFLKRYAADYEKESGKRILPEKAPATGRKIAVVGGGVEGLSAAYFSARLGHETKVIEASVRLGGLLNSAIAHSRLTGDILSQDIDSIVDMGVTVQTESMLGRDFSIADLLEEGFESVFLAAGGWDSRLIRGTTERPIPGTFLLLDLIKAESDFSCGADAVILGGGTLALEAARICRKRGAKTITLLFRENPENSPLTDEDIDTLGDDHIHVIFNAATLRILGQGNSLSGLAYVDNGSPEEKIIPADTLVFSSGRFPELVFKKFEPEPAADIDNPPSIQWEGVLPYKKPDQRNETGLFSAGDVLSDYSAAIKAIAAGRRAAASIHRIMYGIPPDLPENVVTPETVLQNVDHVECVNACPRQIMPIAQLKDIEAGKDLEIGFTEETARAEASRCLQCGLICYERTADQKEPLTVATSA